MKKMMKFFGFIAVAVMSLTACQNEIDEQVNANNEGVTLEIVADMATRSTFGEKVDGAYPSTWTGNETVRFIANDRTIDGAQVETKPTEAGATTHFNVTFTGGTDIENGVIFALTPIGNYSSGLGGWGSHTAYSYTYLTVPTTQTPLANSVDEAAHILIAEHNYEGAFPTGTIGMSFKHALAYGKMKLTLPEGVEASQVILHFTQDVAGNNIRRYYEAKDPYAIGDYSDADKKDITLIPTNVVDGVYWFGILPTGVLEGDMEIEVVATNGNIYKKTIATADDLAFNKGEVSSFKVTMAAVTPIEPETIATIDFTVQGFANATAVSTVNDDADMFCATFDKGTNNNAPKYYSNNVTVPAVRVYGGSTMTISALQSFQLDKIVLTYGSGDNTNSISADSGSFDTDTWTATEDLTTSVTFTIGGTSGHRRISKVDIYYSEAVIPFSMSAENLTIPYAAQDGAANVSISGADDYTFTVTSNAEWLTVEASLNESNQVVFSATENTSAESRTATITITATNGSATETATFTITQSEGLKIVTINEFLDAAVDDVVVYQITGVISNITNTTFGNFDLTDETGTVYIYGIKDADGNNIWSSLGLVDGDTLTIQGNRGEYNSSPQMINGVYVSHDVNNTSRIISVSSESLSFAYNATEAKDVTVTVAGNTTTLSATASESWVTTNVSDNTVSVSVTENTVEEERNATITIIYGESTKTVTVTQAAKPAEGAPVEQTVEIDLATVWSEKTDFTEGTTYTLKEGILDMTFKQKNNNSTSNYYGSGQMRLYKNDIFTFSSTKNLKSVVFTCTGASYSKTGTVSTGSHTSSNNVVTWTASNNTTKSFDVTLSGSAWRITGIEVTYYE